MREMGVDAPPVDAALRDLVTFWAREIVDGATDPYAGASRIWRRAWWQLGSPPDLAIFVGLASEWEDHPEDREAIEVRSCTRRGG
jgi:hypothetical protein